MTRGADYVGRAGNGHDQRRFEEPGAPDQGRLVEALTYVAAALAGVPKCRTMAEAIAVSTTALMRAGEAWPDLLRKQEIRVAMALAGSLAEVRAPAAHPAAPVSYDAKPAPTFSDADLANFTAGLAKQLAEQLKAEEQPLNPPVSRQGAAVTAQPPVGPPLCDAAYWVERIHDLEERRRFERMRGEASGTASTKLTQSRKRLRALMQIGAEMSDETRREAEHLLGLAALKAPAKKL